ncbi:hypothetical protein VTI74DRAFT_1532 [Chaetomium olivicolor]
MVDERPSAVSKAKKGLVDVGFPERVTSRMDSLAATGIRRFKNLKRKERRQQNSTQERATAQVTRASDGGRAAAVAPDAEQDEKPKMWEKGLKERNFGNRMARILFGAILNWGHALVEMIRASVFQCWASAGASDKGHGIKVATAISVRLFPLVHHFLSVNTQERTYSVPAKLVSHNSGSRAPIKTGAAPDWSWFRL